MSSKLRLRKKKYHPPMQEPTAQPKMESNKNEDEHKKTNNKTYAQVVSSSTTQEEKITNTRSCKQSESMNTTEELKQINLQEYVDIASSSSQVYNENEIFQKAIESANKHKIKIEPGRKDRGYGNCVFEAVINNINDRDCFDEKLFQTPNWYRWSWMNQMMERLITGICPWNPGYSLQQIREGFAKIKESGVYEIDFFGDMMIVGIACGIKKRILIFNTNENLVHDPISVIDPTQYDARIRIENETPVVVAYNNYHYENLHPVDENDRQETIRLVESYTNGRYYVDYGFSKADIRYLISPSPKHTRQERRDNQQECARPFTSTKREKYKRGENQEQLRLKIECKKPDKPENQNNLNLTSNNLHEETNKQTRMTSSQNPKIKIIQDYNHEKQINESKMLLDSLHEQNIHKQPWITESSKTQKIKGNTLQQIKKTKNMPTHQSKRNKISEDKLILDNPNKIVNSQVDKNKNCDVKHKANSQVNERKSEKISVWITLRSV